MDYKCLRNSSSIRLVIIGALCLVLLIPMAMIESLISEREARRNSAAEEVSGKWGRDQTITGPILTVPFKKYSKNNNYKTVYSVEYAHFLPEELSISAHIDADIRYRGIYEVVLYNSRLDMSGSFMLPDMKGVKISDEDVMWQDAYVSIGITDMKGIREAIRIQWNQSDYIADPGIESGDIATSGVSAKITLDRDKSTYPFSLALDMNGSRQLNIVPVGKETRVTFSSNWGNPSFTGEFLPDTREIHENGFTADWNILHLNRNFPQQWIGDQYCIGQSAFGTKLLLPVDEYQKTMRTSKYAILFVALTFLSFFVIEVMNKRSVHPVQYLMIGLSLILFYSLLLSVSEHFAFNHSYIVSSVSVIIMISAYTKGFLRSRRFAAMIAGILTVLYGFLYVVLQLQDYSLVLGSAGLFAALGIVMYVTRKIDWSAVWSVNESAGTVPEGAEKG